MVSLPLLIICLTLPLLLLFFFQNSRTIKKPPFPPGPRGLPIIGNLHQLNNSALHLQLWQLSKKYGPLFSLQLGLRQAIVVSSAKVAKELLKDHDLEVSGRSKLLSQQKLSYNGLEIIFSAYGEFWREIRKICVVHVLSSRRVSMFSSMREFEIKQMIRTISLHASSSKVTNLNELLMSLTSTIICRIAFGRSYEDEGTERSRFHRMLNECQALMSTLFGTVLGVYLSTTRYKLELYDDNDCDLKSPLKKPDSASTPSPTACGVKEDFSVLTNDEEEEDDMLVGATDTATAMTVWAMTALLKNSRVMKKVQEEIRNLGGKKDFLGEEDDIQKFPYFKAVLKEVMRLHLPAPLLSPRETNEACIIDGYEIPAKTIVYVNAWAIHRDPKAWKDPEEFLPERFLDNTIDFRGQDFELIPFGAGRRICPGVSMATATLDLILANLLNSFDWDLPAGMKKEDIDTEVLPGLAQHKKNPLCATMFHSFLLILCLTIPVYLLFLFQYRKTIKKLLLPPGPRGLPIIGNLHQLDNSALYQHLWQLSKKYGMRPTIVVCSPKVAKGVMKDHDLQFCGRPKLLGQQKLSYNGLDLAFSPYNNYWKEIRKTCVIHVLSSRLTNLNELLMSLANTIICRIALGRRYEEEGTETSRFLELFKECQP
ncbi:Cytochrome P450 83B1 [Glycine max]|nr:Cytochrome P450 83B1 [Glycine max]